MDHTLLNENQLKAIELLVNGKTVTEVSKELNISRQTIYDWKKKDNFIKEFERQISELRTGIENNILSEISPVLKQLKQIALHGESEKNRLEASIYLVNRVVGTPTSKRAEVKEENDNNKDVDMDTLLKEIRE